MALKNSRNRPEIQLQYSLMMDSPNAGTRLVVISVALCLILFDVVYYNQNDNNYKSPVALQDKKEEIFPRRRLIAKDDAKSHVEFDSNDPHLSLFQISDYTVLGPSQFAKPTHVIHTALQAKLKEENEQNPKKSAKAHDVEVAPMLKPVLGKHRADQDAVFVFASEYDLSIYQGFILSLRKTGYKGDIVLAVSPLDVAAPGAKPTPRQTQLHEFFSSDPNVIIYVVPFVCFNAEGESVDSSKGGMRVCQCNVLYGNRNVTTIQKKEVVTDWEALDDWRIARPVATTRYELYWLWAINYNKHAWLMLVDARDTYFQTDPFAAVPRESNLDRKDGVIFFFGVSNVVWRKHGRAGKDGPSQNF
jgi:hypothetical protein